MLRAIVRTTVTGAPWPVALVADTETGYVPDAVGVPLMTPVAELSVRPGGRPSARYEVMGGLLAMRV